MENQQRSFGEVIKNIRKQRKMTQKMLSQNICSQSVLSRIENDGELPNVLVMAQLCQRLGVTIDQVMQMHSTEIQQVHALIEQLTFFFFHKNYQLLDELLHRPNLLNHLYLDTDLQLYHYYLGSCYFFLHHDSESALKELKRGLSYTFQLDKSNVSATEIQLISCIGSVYEDLRRMDLARQQLKYSLQLFQKMPPERMSNMAAKIFYNYAHFLYSQKEAEEALAIAKEGITVARKQKSYYYLDDLFLLTGRIYEYLGESSVAKQYFKASADVQYIRTI
ncbi:MAG TPA: helix-turn-helix domain-containing protein [Candidatus Enterococcus stercoravium]|nr:helix-turn-helix domain-containing protein [Candidatus Enterococcus stercoravium]